MAARPRRSRRGVLALVLASLVGATLVWAFWPRPMAVDLEDVTVGPMSVTIREEGRTVVRDNYVVSAPVTARVSRIELDPGDPVKGGETVLAYMMPADPAVLDPRTRRQAEAAVEAAEAALAAAEAEHGRALAERTYAQSELARMTSLRRVEAAAQRDLEAARRSAEGAFEAVAAAQATIHAAEADLRHARALLEPPERMMAQMTGNPHPPGALPIRAPVTGRLLQVMHESEGVVAAGTALAEIGDPEGDLEVEVELLSSDAVAAEPGDPVRIEAWGGPEPLAGEVERIEPWGFTKYSALGVEEQRVIAVIRFTGKDAARARLGHGYRIEAVIEIWADPQALRVPSSALFRAGGDWAVFRAQGGRARLTQVSVAQDNGVVAKVRQGLAEGDSVVTHPSAELRDGARITQRKTG
ncbi:efflux RND transporter periplasmic adaptor subunit [Parvularcula oceani]|uniref:efflux RND transporter periplasmic adaptor subunit n=1 Tax=Parvularcula oceani TaxID=1247963 RepID=UPI0004E0E34D|nr:efflux RND transporter periplasmic adaptor subunit [Parvularcula oceani]